MSSKDASSEWSMSGPRSGLPDNTGYLQREADQDYLPDRRMVGRKGEDGKWQKAIIRPVHDDPWKVHAAREYLGRMGKQLSEITVWHGDVCRITDPLPPRILT